MLNSFVCIITPVYYPARARPIRRTNDPMYRYDEIDQRLVDERVRQFRDQTRRFLAGELSEDEFRPLRLRNGLYIQRHAPMLRVAIPYGLLSSRAAAQARAHRAHLRPRLRPLHARARTCSSTGRSSRTCPTSSPSSRRVQMHAIQTSGNCVRNITTDHFAGVARRRDRRFARVVRDRSGSGRRSTPSSRTCRASSRSRSTARPNDRAATWVHDIGLHAVRNDARRDRLPRDRRRRPRPHADHRPRRSASSCRGGTCSPTSTRSCACTTATAGATTSTRRASRSW